MDRKPWRGKLDEAIASTKDLRVQKKSEALVQSLQVHEISREIMWREYDRLDSECVQIAKRIGPLVLAESRDSEAAQEELRSKQVQREAVRLDWETKQGKLRAQIGQINGPLIRAFNDWCISELRWVSKQLEFHVVPSSGEDHG